jgi:Bacterial capsule synthesis protein PGA_cap
MWRIGGRTTTLFAAAAAVALAGGCGESGAPERTTAATVAPAPLPEPRPTRLTIAVSGDLLIHAPIWQRALQLGGGARYDFAPLLRPLRRYLARADLAFCHVETPLSPAPPSGYPIFNAPPALARAIRATGWDACDTASNHSLDLGQAGIAATAAALDRAGVRHTGSFARPAGARRTLLLRAKGVRVALLAYTESTNGLPLPHRWSVNLADGERILRDARRARRRGAQVVIVNVHWGDEYAAQPSAAQRRLADLLTRSRAITAVVGQHAHVVQPIRRVNGKLVVFGAGNLLSNQTAACCPAAAQDGLIARLHVVVPAGGGRARLRRVSYVPTWVRHPDYAVLPVGDALRRGLADPAALRASYARTVAVAGRARGVTPIPARLP